MPISRSKKCVSQEQASFKISVIFIPNPEHTHTKDTVWYQAVFCQKTPHPNCSETTETLLPTLPTSGKHTLLLQYFFVSPMHHSRITTFLALNSQLKPAAGRRHPFSSTPPAKAEAIPLLLLEQHKATSRLSWNPWQTQVPWSTCLPFYSKPQRETA